jgi:hypothetical protein
MFKKEVISGNGLYADCWCSLADDSWCMPETQSQWKRWNCLTSINNPVDGDVDSPRPPLPPQADPGAKGVSPDTWCDLNVVDAPERARVLFTPDVWDTVQLKTVEIY